MKTNTNTNKNISRPETRLSDPRNADILVWIGDRLLPRELAKVSVFDSSVQGGDAVWEGLRIYNSKIFKLDEHLDRKSTRLNSSHGKLSRMPSSA